MKDEEIEILLGSLAKATPRQLVEMLEVATACIYYIAHVNPKVKEGELAAVSAAREFVMGIEKQLREIGEKLTVEFLFYMIERNPIIPDLSDQEIVLRSNITYN